MEKEGTLDNQISKLAKKFIEISKDEEVLVISHFDTDGITSAAIMIQSLKRLDKKFSLKIIKNLEREFIEKLPKNKTLLFLDLASGSLETLSKLDSKNIFIIDHHEINENQIPNNVEIINPELHDKQKISSSGLTYLFCKELNEENKEFAKLAIIGMIGDMLEKDIDKMNNGILNDGEIRIRKGALIFPSTRPLNRVLEYSSNPYIPGVTGNIKGVLELMRDANLSPTQKGYPSLLELNKDEMEDLVTAIMLRNPKTTDQEIVGNIYLISLYNKLEDAREISSKINACSRLGDSNTALQFCMEIPSAKKKAESKHAKYRQHIISALKFVSETEKIQGKDYTIINAKENIKETMVGTIASILSNSKLYESGTVIITMAYSEEEKIKVSARNVGREGRNVRELLTNANTRFNGEVGGHEFAAGCLINKEYETDFINDLKKSLEIETIKI
tara:strand:- start:1872 stop:3212 length:1341 start_codon:yes stop_codon:yes gene_type:complete